MKRRSVSDSGVRKLWRCRRGATALELAFVLPVFVVLLFGIFQFGLAQHKLSSIRFAMNTASRGLMLNPNLTEAQLRSHVQSILTSIADPNVTITLAIQDQVGGRVAHLTGVYTSHIGVTGLATYPLTWQTTLDTSLPAA